METLSQLGRRLLFIAIPCLAALLPPAALAEEFDPDAPIDWDIPRLPLADALQRFADALDDAWFEGLNPDDEARAPNIIVGPIKGRMSTRQAFHKLTSRVCAEHFFEERDVPITTLQDVPMTYQSRSKRPPILFRDLNIQQATRLAALIEIERAFEFEIVWAIWVPETVGERTRFVPSHRVQEIVGPITGRTSLGKALKEVLRGTDTIGRWVGGGQKAVLLLEPPKRRFVVGDCQENVLVTQQTLLTSAFGPVLTLDRQRIDALGVASLPDLLRYTSQTAFTRPRGYRLSGAQYAEMRGLGAANTKVLINGKPADASAPDLGETAAFDLNTIPLGAVDRIEISPDVPSLLHGADAIGGVVNIVLRQAIDTPYVGLRFGTGAGNEWTGTIAGGTNGDRLKSAVVLDVFEGDELLGCERDRWRNMDFTRFGGKNHTSPFAAPANLRSVDGQALPGLSSSFAAVAVDPDGDIRIVDGAQNRTSLLAMQAIKPATERVTLSTRADLAFNRATVRGEALVVRHSSTFRLIPALAQGLILGSEHPQNPFGIDVLVDAALTGLPPRQHRGTSELRRGVLEVEGKLGDSWTYSMFGLYSDERAKSWRENTVDPLTLMDSLSGRNEQPIDILSLTPGTGALSILLPRAQVDRYLVGGSQITAKMSGDLFALPTGEVSADLGMQARNEFVRFDERVGRVERDIYSGFGVLTIPTLDRVDLSLGARRDFYSDVGPITRMQYGITWRPARFELHAVHSESFNAPSHYDLYFPRFEIPFQIFDPQRQEIASLIFITGGNVNLRPTTARSTNLGVSWKDNADRWRASVDLWNIEMRNRVGVVLPFALLANENQLTIDRIHRDRPTASDEQAGLPGRLHSIDITRGNFGTTQTRGFDVSVQQRFDIGPITLEPRLDVTYTDEFRDSAVPTHDRTLRDRVGVASEFGTITPWRVVGCVKSESAVWRINLCGRYHSSYSDYIATSGILAGRDIPSNTFWDVNTSWDFSEHVSLSVGAFNILDEGAPFAEIGDSYGFDSSQSDLEGRTLFLKITGSL